MAKWRVHAVIGFGNILDRDTFAEVELAYRAGKNIFDVPFAASTSNPAGTPRRCLHCRLNTQADADILYTQLSNFLLDPLQIPLALVALGYDISDPANVRGKVSKHLCTHDDAAISDCSTSQYTETVV